MEELYLIYGERINEYPNSNGEYEYELYFSTQPEIVWGVDWNQNCPSACAKENMRPEGTTYSEIKRLKCDVPFLFMENNSCFSGQDMIDQIIACMWEDISLYDEYPEPFRIVFKFGETLDKVKEKLSKREIYFENEKAIDF